MADNNARKIVSVVDGAGVNHTDANGLTTRTGGGAVSAFDTLLVAASGCSCSVLGSLLKRDGFEPTKLTAEVEGQRGEMPPRPYVSLTIHFTVECAGLTAEKLQNYAELAEKMCPVVQSLGCKVTPEVTLL
jgi:uncharacterized OsmC-like protein